MKQTITNITLSLLTLGSLLFSAQLIQAQCHIDDWAALKALYEATGGDGWKNNEGWEVVKSDEPPLDCNIEGMYAVELDGSGRVSSINIKFNNLLGSIPSEIGSLSNLNYLSLDQNKLSGDIPSEIGSLSNLGHLDLSQNQLSGKIPTGLTNLNNLNHLDLGHNEISGKIPPEIGNLNNLNYLSIRFNRLSGNVPMEIGNMSNLNYLSIRFNKLSGKIPLSLANLNKMNSLDLSDNQLTGKIPSELGKLVSLVGLNLSDNQLIGNIPPELGKLSNLKGLYLIGNQLTGHIPPELGNLSNLRSLWIGHNQLSGNIPNEFSNLTLSYLDVSDNQLSGKIPNINIILDLEDGIWEFYFEANYFIYDDFENFNEFLGYPFAHWPQYYQHNSEQNILIDDSTETVLLSAPFEIPGNFTYQWYKNSLQIEGAIDTILQLNTVKLNDLGDYRLAIRGFYDDNRMIYVSDPISVRRTDLEGCTDANACNYNQFAMIDDGTCEYLSCDTLTNPIEIRTTNETILSDSLITYDLVIDSLGLDYSADGLNFTLDTRGNYNIESVEVINPVLSIVEVDVSQLYPNTLSINRINSQLLTSKAPLLRVVASIVVEDIPTDEGTCSHFAIYGGTELASGHFISFDNIYIDVPFSDCSPYNGYSAEGENWLPLVLSISPQNCKTNTGGLAEIKILEDSQAPYTYTCVNEQGTIVLESTSSEKLIEVPNLNAGNYQLEVFDASGKKTTMLACIPLTTSLNGNETCNTNCVDYVTIPYGKIRGTHLAKKEIEIKGFVNKDETVEFSICK